MALSATKERLAGGGMVTLMVVKDKLRASNDRRCPQPSVRLIKPLRSTH